MPDDVELALTVTAAPGLSSSETAGPLNKSNLLTQSQLHAMFVELWFSTYVIVVYLSESLQYCCTILNLQTKFVRIVTSYCT